MSLSGLDAPITVGGERTTLRRELQAGNIELYQDAQGYKADVLRDGGASYAFALSEADFRYLVSLSLPPD